MHVGGHVQFAVKDLEAEKSYVVEIRAMSASGAGAWCRVGEPICTALVAQESKEILQCCRLGKRKERGANKVKFQEKIS